MILIKSLYKRSDGDVGRGSFGYNFFGPGTSRTLSRDYNDPNTVIVLEFELGGQEYRYETEQIDFNMIQDCVFEIQDDGTVKQSCEIKGERPKEKRKPRKPRTEVELEYFKKLGLDVGLLVDLCQPPDPNK